MPSDDSTRWPFDQPPDAGAITQRRVILPEKGKSPRPILYVTHDEDDHGWQFLDGDEATTKDAAVVRMDSMLTRDPTLAEIADLPPGWVATRVNPGAPWKRSRHE
jgi:hypothetical protein